MKYLFTFLIAVLSVFKMDAARLTSAKFVETATTQRMLSQKIAKNYMLVAYNNEHQKAELNLRIAISLFNRNLEALKNYAVGNNKLTSALETEESAWENLSKGLQKEKTPGNAIEVLKLSEVVLQAANKVVVVAIQESNKNKQDAELFSLINITGKQRMLSHRLCLLFVTQKLQDQMKEDERKISNTVFEQVFHEMDDAIGFIISSAYNIQADTEELAGLTSLEFDNLKGNKEDFINGKFEVDYVNTITNKLAKLYTSLNYAYSKL